MEVSFRSALLICLTIFVIEKIVLLINSSRDLQTVFLQDDQFPSRENNFASSGSTILYSRSVSLPLIDVLYGGQGSDPGFMEELQASIKSVLINAPLDSKLRIHLMLDQEACEAITTEILEKHQLSQWQSRQPLSIHMYNVESLIPYWKDVIDMTFRHFPERLNRYRHTIGAYFRLFAYEVLPDDVGNFLYMDSDVVVMSNLNKLWQQVYHRTSYFQWGHHMCSAFVIINKSKLEDFWKRIQNYDILQLKGYNLLRVRKQVQMYLGDQFLIRAMNITEPHMIDILPKEWDISANDGPWWSHKGEGLEIYRHSGVGMLHFNGGGKSKESIFKSHKFLIDNGDRFNSTWGLAHYYNRLSWSWARFMVENQIGDTAHQITIEHHVIKYHLNETLSERNRTSSTHVELF